MKQRQQSLSMSCAWHWSGKNACLLYSASGVREKMNACNVAKVKKLLSHWPENSNVAMQSKTLKIKLSRNTQLLIRDFEFPNLTFIGCNNNHKAIHYSKSQQNIALLNK